MSMQVPSDKLNWVETGGQFGRKRRFPTFIVTQLPNGNYKAFDQQDNDKMKCGSPDIEGLESMLRIECEYRTRMG